MWISQPACLKPQLEVRGQVLILTFTDGKSRTAENVIATELAALPDDIGQTHLLLDFGKVTMINSLELGTLVSLHKKLRASGRRLTLFNLDSKIYEVFEVTRLNTLLQVLQRKPQDGAVASLKHRETYRTNDE